MTTTPQTPPTVPVKPAGTLAKVVDHRTGAVCHAPIQAFDFYPKETK